MDPSGSAGTPHQAFTSQRGQLQLQPQHPHHHQQSQQQHQHVHPYRDDPDQRHRHFHHVPPQQQHQHQQHQQHQEQDLQHLPQHPIHPAHHQQQQPPQLLVSQPQGVPHPSNVGPAVTSTTTTSTLWQYFKRGEKMQKTNKFEANCIFCERTGMLTKVRGEKRMMSGHLRNCNNAPPAAKSEGEAVAIDLKNRRISATRGRSNPTPGVHISMRKSSKGRVPMHSGSAVSAAAVAMGGGGGSSGGENTPFFKQEHPNPGFMTNDGVRIYFEERGVGHPLILIHGWSGSSSYFVRNFDTLAKYFRVIRFDLRGHGESDKPSWGFHVHRLAADLWNLMDHLELSSVALLGCSLGCAVIWAYVELFGAHRISAAMFVDQSPWQMNAPDGSWQFGSSGAFSEGAIAHLAAKLEVNPRECHEKNVQMCLNHEPTQHESEFFVGESLKSRPIFLSKLMADHSNIDWRSVLALVTCPALVIVGKRSKVFPSEGVAYAADKMPNARLISFDEGSHWLFYEEADRFNSVVTAFLQKLQPQS